MAFSISTGSTSIPFGTNLRIGYRAYGSASGFTYLPFIPSYNDLPYTFSVAGVGQWELEYTVICSSCAGSQYSSPDTVVVTVYS